MTVATSANRIEYTGDAVTTAFAFPYYFFANGDLKVYLDGVLQTITTHYTVAGAGVGAGGTVTFVTAPPSGDLVVIYREVAITQSVDYTPNDPFPANTHEQALDRLTMISQQIDEEVGRALKLPSTSTYGDLTLPDPQSGYFLQWKADLSGLQNVVQVPASSYTVSAFMQTVLDDANAADARTTLGVPDAAETLTNKTLTDPVFNGTLSGTAIARGALVYKSANETITTATYTHLSFNTESYDTDTIHDTVTNNQRLTVPAGVTKIKLSAQVCWAITPSSAMKGCFISKNDETTTPTCSVPGLPCNVEEAIADGSRRNIQNIASPIITVTAGDYFTLCVYHDAGSNLDLLAQTGYSPVNAYTWFAMEIIA